jgi:hypothetical protein
MRGRNAVVLYVAALVIAVVASDVLFFRHHTWARLAANVGIVLAFGILYLWLRKDL